MIYYLSSLLLLISLISLSGYAGVSTNFEKQKTELVSHGTFNNSTVAKYLIAKYPQQKIINNYFTLFNFGSLLKKHHNNYSIALKSQKEIKIKFFNFQFIMQKLNAKINSTKYKNNFI